MNEAKYKTTGHQDNIFLKRGTIRDTKVFLDLKGDKSAEKIEACLKKFGAVVEEFLSKDVEYVISNRKPASVPLFQQHPNQMKLSTPGTFCFQNISLLVYFNVNFNKLLYLVCKNSSTSQ